MFTEHVPSRDTESTAGLMFVQAQVAAPSKAADTVIQIIPFLPLSKTISGRTWRMRRKAVGNTLTRKRQRANLCFHICVYCAVFVFLVSGKVLAERFRWSFQNIPNIPGNYIPKLLCWNVTFLPKKELLFPSLDFLIKKFWEKQNPKATEGWGDWLSTSSLCSVSHFVSIHAGGIFTPPLLSVSRRNSEFAQERIGIDQPLVCFGLEIFSK